MDCDVKNVKNVKKIVSVYIGLCLLLRINELTHSSFKVAIHFWTAYLLRTCFKVVHACAGHVRSMLKHAITHISSCCSCEFTLIETKGKSQLSGAYAKRSVKMSQKRNCLLKFLLQFLTLRGQATS